MGLAMEIVSGYATNPSTAVTACTPATGDTFNVRNFQTGAAHLMGTWALGATTGITQIRSPRLHDNVRGIRTQHVAASSLATVFDHTAQYLYAQDTLTLEITGGGSEVDSMAILNYYDNLPGTDARLYTMQELQPRIQNISAVEVDITSGTTAGSYGGATAINATFDQFRANTDYAILGYTSSREITSIGVRSADFGNLRVGGPGTLNRLETRDWFVRLSNQFRVPAIPVFNAANKSNTLVDVVENGTATAVIVVMICAQLST